jgi:hypothetical protein
MLRQVKRNAKQFKLFIEKNRRKLLSFDALPSLERNCLPHPSHALYTQTTSRIGIWAIPKLSQFDDLKRLKH